MELLVKYICGSRLYGTNVPTSDLDYLSIHMDSLEDIVLGHSKHTVTNNTKVGKGRNSQEDIDDSSKELRRFIRDCLSGQTYAFEALFLPDDMIVQRTPIYDRLVENRHRLLSNNMSSFIGYLRGQSAKYSLKGTKLAVLTEIRDAMLIEKDNKQSLSEFMTKNSQLTTLPFVKEYFKGKGKSKSSIVHGEEADLPSEQYFDIVNSSFPGSRKILEVCNTITDHINKYGDRVNTAMKDGGIDLKAYYHALRLAWELEEFLTTQTITFPCPKRDVLLSIRKGEWDKETVEEFIGEEIERVLNIPNNLPEPDYEFWEKFILDTYLKKPKFPITIKVRK